MPDDNKFSRIVSALISSPDPVGQGLLSNVANLSAQRNDISPIGILLGMGGAPAGGLAMTAAPAAKAISPAIAASRDYLENVVTKWAQGNMTSKEVKEAFKQHGWTTDLRRGGNDVEAFDPTGMAHYLTP